MKKLIRLAVGAGAVLGFSTWVAPAAHAEGAPPGPLFSEGANNAVFVQTDNPAGNQVVAYHRAADGTLTLANTYDTGGLGGVLNGSAVDHTASQGALTYDQQDALLYAVNAGSNTLSVFSVNGDELSLRQVVSSGGVFPVSVAVHGNLVYVLNADGNGFVQGGEIQRGGSVQGYVALFGHLFPLPGSNRNLGLTIPTNTNQYVSTPGQVAFSPNGSQLIVTTKASSDAIDVFQVGPFGELSLAPVANAESGAVPFAISFDSSGHMVIANAGTDSLSTFTLNTDGSVTLLDTVGTGKAATCWVAPAQGYFYASNAGSSSVSGYQESPASGQLTLLGATTTDPGTIDASASEGGQFLYVQTGAEGIVDEFTVNANGTLTKVGSVTVAGGVGGEGIVAF